MHVRLGTEAKLALVLQFVSDEWQTTREVYQQMCNNKPRKTNGYWSLPRVKKGLMILEGEGRIVSETQRRKCACSWCRVKVWRRQTISEEEVGRVVLGVVED
jgi:hypothetical protein